MTPNCLVLGVWFFLKCSNTRLCHDPWVFQVKVRNGLESGTILADDIGFTHKIIWFTLTVIMQSGSWWTLYQRVWEIALWSLGSFKGSLIMDSGVYRNIVGKNWNRVAEKTSIFLEIVLNPTRVLKDQATEGCNICGDE